MTDKENILKNSNKAEKFIKQKARHLHNSRQEIGFYELCSLLEDYLKYNKKKS